MNIRVIDSDDLLSRTLRKSDTVADGTRVHVQHEDHFKHWSEYVRKEAEEGRYE